MKPIRWLCRWMFRLLVGRWPGNGARLHERLPDLADEDRDNEAAALEDQYLLETRNDTAAREG